MHKQKKWLVWASMFLSTIALGACTPQQIIQAYFGPEGQGNRAEAIAYCESRMNPEAVSRTNDHGLFQINIVHRDDFQRVTGAPWSAVYNPYFNTMYAKWLWEREGWSPWACA